MKSHFRKKNANNNNDSSVAPAEFGCSIVALTVKCQHPRPTTFYHVPQPQSNLISLINKALRK